MGTEIDMLVVSQVFDELVELDYFLVKGWFFLSIFKALSSVNDVFKVRLEGCSNYFGCNETITRQLVIKFLQK